MRVRGLPDDPAYFPGSAISSKSYLLHSTRESSWYLPGIGWLNSCNKCFLSCRDPLSSCHYCNKDHRLLYFFCLPWVCSSGCLLAMSYLEGGTRHIWADLSEFLTLLMFVLAWSHSLFGRQSTTFLSCSLALQIFVRNASALALVSPFS